VTQSRRGRRAGTPDTRGAILDAARRRFAEGGYARTTIRAIAGEAGVDPALVVHFFGSKEALFRAVIEWPFDPEVLLERLAAPGPESIGRRLARGFLEFWDSADIGPRLQAVLRGAVTHEAAADLIRQFLTEVLYERVVPLIGPDQARLRVDLALGQLLGVAVLRHILRVEPIASEPIDLLVDQLAPTLDAYLSPAQPRSAD
jgi:AcrR family transcriptional regulator